MWDWAIYGALIASALLVAGGFAFLAVRVLQGWRSFKRLRRHVFRDLDRLLEKVEATVDFAASASDSSRLDVSIARLRTSLARLAVLRDAFSEATDLVGRVAVFVPRK
jgi:hypothetical protein